MTTIHGVIHGTTIELKQATGLPDGQTVAVTIQPVEQPPTSHGAIEIPSVELWVNRLVFDSSAHPIERVVKGTRLVVEELVAELNLGRSDKEMLHAHPELETDDLEALRHYALWPVGLRRSCGAWAEDADELDKYLEWTRQHRKIRRREIEE